MSFRDTNGTYADSLEEFRYNLDNNTVVWSTPVLIEW